MIYTLSGLNKKLKELNDNFAKLSLEECNKKEFLCALNEDVESIRPKYDFLQTQEKLNGLEAKIRLVKHSLNVANITTKVDGYDMTIDEMLVYIPQLTKRVSKLGTMNSKLEKVRDQMGGRNVNFIDYRMLNYSLTDCDAQYKLAYDELKRAQLALDYTNAKITIDVDV